ncbi:MAG: hypothetical protein NC250_04720 [Alistipes senegalensis]|nr:hypothetical protein [Bacteroides cellulosilyticus]MCM1352013.1 hypothetical protein [Alistipes senegalensis]
MKRFLILLAASAALAAPAAQAQASEQKQERIEISPTMPEPGPNETVIRKPGTTDEWIVTTEPEAPGRSLPQLYMEGGSYWMTAITLLLIGVCFAAWKAPRWVKELGLLAILTGFLSLMVGVYGVFDFVNSYDGDVPFWILCGGFRVALIAPLYGTIVYMISLVLRIALKPRM